MSDAYTSIFSSDPKTGAPTYAQLEARRKVAMALATRNRPYPKTIGEGLTALGEGLGEGYNLAQLQRAEAGQTATDVEGQRILQGGAATPAAPGQTSLVEDPATTALAMASPETLAMVPPEVAKSVPPQVKLASMPIEEWKQRTARNESGGQPDPYRAIGPVSRRGDYPYGKYQVMGENIPKWTKAYLGKELTPQEFLESPDAQEQVASGQGGKYLAKYGPVGAAEAWFAGEKGRIEGRSTRKDTLGTHIDEYVRRFNVPLVNRDQIAASAANAPPAAAAFAPEETAQPPVQLASLGGMPTPDTAPAPDPAARDMVAQALAAQQQPALPPPQQVAQAAPLPAQPAPAAAQAIQKAPMPETRPTPPGVEPTLQRYLEGTPALRQRMERALEVERNPRYSDTLRADARQRYIDAAKEAQDGYTKQWTIWHERTKKEEEFNLGAEGRQRTRELAPFQLQKAQKEAEPTTKEVDGRLLERDPQTQKWTDVTPGGHLPNLTVEQSKILGFYQRGKWALHNLGDGKELTDFAAWHAAGMPVVGNYAVNAKFQRQLQAANELAAVQLRLETGTAAPPAELKNVIDRMVPRPGDKPEAQLQKDQLRTSLIKSYADMMGSKGAPYVDKFNREFELDRKEYDKKQDAITARSAPPIRITHPEQIDLLKPGQRFIAPDGTVKRKPE